MICVICITLPHFDHVCAFSFLILILDLYDLIMLLAEDIVLPCGIRLPNWL